MGLVVLMPESAHWLLFPAMRAKARRRASEAATE
jgi:hypothetical protein